MIGSTLAIAAAGGGIPPSIRGSNSADSEVSGSQTFSIAAPTVVAGDYVVAVITVNNSSAITSFGDFTGWTQDIYETSTPERLLVLSKVVVGNESWVGGNIQCTVAAQYAACVFSVADASSKVVGAFNSSTGSAVTVSSINVGNNALLLSLSTSDNDGSVVSVTNASYTFSAVVESTPKGTNDLAGEAAVYSAGNVSSGATGNVTVTIDTSNGVAAALMAFS